MGGKAETQVAGAQKEQAEEDADEEGGQSLLPVAVEESKAESGESGSTPGGKPAAEEHPRDAGAEEQLFTCRTDETEQRHTENIVLLLFKHGLCAGVVQSERGEQKRKSQCQQKCAGAGLNHHPRRV